MLHVQPQRQQRFNSYKEKKCKKEENSTYDVKTSAGCKDDKKVDGQGLVLFNGEEVTDEVKPYAFRPARAFSAAPTTPPKMDPFSQKEPRCLKTGPVISNVDMTCRNWTPHHLKS
ncbi:hypothetical protein BU15DRAFT_79610 [Melanogaster broomeanus]|nr:hypothetical protein BU15DRAFT_79610 [Melanogaster broomeanus]